MRRATLLVLLVLALPASAMAAGPPTVSKQAPANITQTAATLRATVNPRGQATSFHFEYGPTAALGAATGEAPAGAGTTSRAASARIAGLEPATTYFWRVVATNAAGVTASPQGTFKTATPPGTIRIRVAQGTVPFGAVTAVSGQVLGPQPGGATIAIERQRFPYNEPYNQLGTTVRTAADGTFAFASVGPFFGPTHIRAVRRTGPAVASPAA
ncbi:MAG: hypothetical protein QOE11_685, partial [Solirubrobacteraceae bacterium]|nr:hypothetical protein [Solirubrobacteraceae bacterium]